MTPADLARATNRTPGTIWRYLRAGLPGTHAVGEGRRRIWIIDDPSAAIAAIEAMPPRGRKKQSLPR
jgi:hypothetical protein